MLYGALLLILLIVGFIEYFTGKKEKAKIFFVSNLILIFPMFYFLFNHLYVQYAIKNNKYCVKTDYIEECSIQSVKSRSSSNSSYSYYAILKEHGKVKISHDLYSSLNIDDSVYVVIINGLFKETYASSLIYPTENYTYEN